MSQRRSFTKRKQLHRLHLRQCGEVMCKKILILTSIVILALSSMAFPQAQPQKPSEAPTQKPPEEPLPVLAVPKNYHYASRGRRDPFVNPIPKPVTPPGVAGRPPVAVPMCLQPQGLKGIMLSQTTIAGVVTARDPSMTIVIIGGPGGKTYFARVGDALCDAVRSEERRVGKECRCRGWG